MIPRIPRNLESLEIKIVNVSISLAIIRRVSRSQESPCGCKPVEHEEQDAFRPLQGLVVLALAS
jgi:hypothetical protein